ncbi:MAG: acetate--CoA ligase family protein [Burkholderiaceae bacterium]|nr:acetate--CoA ligase family protein [Burkholderiaceae bacterium]
MSSLSRLINPSSIALIGASPDQAKLAARPLQYLQRYGYQGRIYPVNPKHASIEGVPCVPSIADLPRDVDLALILLPAAGVADALSQCAARGVASAISIAGGFAEAGAADEQQRLTDICDSQGIRLIGPNCVGLLHPAKGVTATFSSELRNRMPRPGKVALFTQSGALGNAMLQSFNDLDIGLAYWVSTGNEADVGLLDLLEHALDDPEVEMVAMYVEGLKHGSRLLELGRRARAAGKAVIVLRAGKSQLGRAAAVSHTGKLAGAWKVWSDVARQSGVINVDSLDDLLDLALLFDRHGDPSRLRAKGLGVLTVSGGMGVLISDAAAQAGLQIPAFSEQTQATLRSVLPEQMTVANPVDTALFTDEQGYALCAEAVLNDPQIGVLLLVLTRLAHDYTALVPWLEKLSVQAHSMGKRVAVSYLSSSDPLLPEDRQRLMQAGGLALSTPERIVVALGHALQAATGDMDPTDAVPATPSRNAAEFLLNAGIPQVPEGVFNDADAAVAFADAQGYPVVLKVVSPDIAHKSEAGGVALNIPDSDALRSAWTGMVGSVTAHAPAASITGYSVQPMLRGGFELIVGCSTDPELGRVLMIGAGGIWAEVLDDVRFLALPTTEAEITTALQSLRIAPILSGARGQACLDVPAAAQSIQRLGRQFLADPWVLEVDLNPVLVRPTGQGVVALDVLVVPSEPAQ